MPPSASGAPRHQGGGSSDVSAGPSRPAIRMARAATPSADPSRSTPIRIGPPGSGRLSSTAEATSGEFAAAATASHAIRADTYSAVTYTRAAGSGCSRKVASVISASVPGRPGQQLAQVVAGHVLDDLPARPGHGAVRPHDGDADQQVARGAVAQPPGPGEPARHHPADGRPVRHVERDLLPVPPQRGRDVAHPRARPARAPPGRRTSARPPTTSGTCRSSDRTATAATPQPSRPPAPRTTTASSCSAAARSTAAASSVDPGAATNAGTIPPTASASAPSRVSPHAAASAFPTTSPVIATPRPLCQVRLRAGKSEPKRALGTFDGAPAHQRTGHRPGRAARDRSG